MTDEQRQSQRSPDEQPESRPVELGAYVAGLVNAVDKGIADEVAPYDLSTLEFSLLRVCMERVECTATQMGEVLPSDAPRISRMVSRLVDMGLLSRRRLRSDRRIIMLRLTEEGMELTSQLVRRVREYEAQLTESISEEELRDFASIASKIVANHASLKQPRTGHRAGRGRYPSPAAAIRQDSMRRNPAWEPE